MLKKFFIAMMAIAVMGFGFVACSDDDDDEDEDTNVTYTYTGTAGTLTFTGKKSTVKQKGTWTIEVPAAGASHMSWTPTDYTVETETSTFTYNDTEIPVYKATLNYTGGTTGNKMDGYFTTDWKTVYTGHGNYVSAYNLTE